MHAFETHLIAKIHHERGDTTDVSEWVLQYQDSQSTKGIPSFGLALPARIKGKPTDKVIQRGDLLEAGFITQKHPGARSEYFTSMVGVVKQVSYKQGLTPNQLEQTSLVVGQHLAGWLANETINYFLAAVLSGKNEYLLGGGYVDPSLYNEIFAKNLDEALERYMNNVLFRILGIRRPQGTLEQLLGYNFRTYPGTGAYYAQWANYEGTAWKMLETYSDYPLHELYATTLPVDRFQQLDGHKNNPKTWGPDKVVPFVFLRPAPFPHGIAPDEKKQPSATGQYTGTATLGNWQYLRLHDLTNETQDSPPTQQSTEFGDADVRTVFFITPTTLAADDVFMKTAVPAVINLEAYRQFGYKPLTWQTQLWPPNGRKTKAYQYFRELNWRVAGQWNQTDQMARSSLTTRPMPWLRAGERLQYWGLFGDERTLMEGYLESVAHSWSPDGGRTSTLEVVRALPASTYGGSKFFAEGLKEYAPVKLEKASYSNPEAARSIKLAPDPEPTPTVSLNIALDAGHGWGNRVLGQFDPGAVGHGHREADIAFMWVMEGARTLRAKGHTVFLTRSEPGENAPLNTRASRAISNNCTFFISIHCNAGPASATGTETFYRDSADKKLAELVQTAALGALELRDRGVKHESQSQHHSLAIFDFNKAACLLETGFITNSSDVIKINSDARIIRFWEALEQALVSTDFDV